MNRYSLIMEKIFFSKYRKGTEEIEFAREEIEKFAAILEIPLPKNLGDIIYSFRYRIPLPSKVKKTAGKGKMWIIRPAGKAKYKFSLVKETLIIPNGNLVEIKIPDSTPGIISQYSLDDEQALLARVRYNRLVDIFTGVTCYSLQNHLRTTVPDMGQVETDEIYVGIDKKGAQYIFPLQAKGGTDQLSIVQIEQDIGMCKSKFSSLICRPLSSQFMGGNVIAMFEFEQNDDGIAIVVEKHYRLVPPDEISLKELESYKKRSDE